MKKIYKICNICGQASEQKESKFVCSVCDMDSKIRLELEKEAKREVQAEALRRSMNMNCY